MDNNKICEKCGSKTEYRVEGYTEGFFCVNCDWSLVTSKIPQIEQDITKYKLYLHFADSQDKKQIKAIAKVAKINYIQARKMPSQEKPLMLEAEAKEIDLARKSLELCNIQYSIEPNFPY